MGYSANSHGLIRSVNAIDDVDVRVQANLMTRGHGRVRYRRVVEIIDDGVGQGEVPLAGGGCSWRLIKDKSA